MVFKGILRRLGKRLVLSRREKPSRAYHNWHRALHAEPLEARVVLSSASQFDAASWDALESDVVLSSLPESSTVPAKFGGKLNGMVWTVVEEVRNAIDTGTLDLAGTLFRDSELVKSGLARVNDRGDIQLYVHLSALGDGVIESLKSLGATIDTTNVRSRIVQAWVPVDSVEALTQMPSVLWLALPGYAVTRTGAVNSAGDEILRAETVRSIFEGLEVDGTGISIGVISDGVDHWTDVSDTDDLPGTITIDPTRSGFGDEGTAMLEIIHDLAPGAALFFSGPSSSMEMVDSINWLVGQGVDVIVDDLGFFSEPFFEDGQIAAAAGAAASAGVVYVSAAGNDAQHNYQAPYVAGASSGNGNWHDFGGGDVGQSVTIPNGGNFDVFLQWSDGFGASNNDYDLFLWDATGMTV